MADKPPGAIGPRPHNPPDQPATAPEASAGRPSTGLGPGLSPGDIRAEVLAANAEANAKAIAARPVVTKVRPPVMPAPDWADDKLLAKANSTEQFGEARLIKFFFAGLVVRDNTASAPNAAGIFDDIYIWTGRSWELDTNHQFKDLLFIVGQVFSQKAWTVYNEAARLVWPKDVPPPDTAPATPAPQTPAPSSPPEQDPPTAAPASGHPAFADDSPNYDLTSLKVFAKNSAKEMKDHPVAVLVKKGDEYMARAHKCWTLPRLTQAAALACSGGRSSLGFKGRWNSLDTYLPCNNGTLDLTTLELMEPRPEHYFNRLVPWDYLGPDVPCDTWDDMLSKCLGGDQELIDYFYLVLGSCLIGRAPKNVFCALGESANNGKSSVFGALGRLLGNADQGGFAAELGPDIFLSQPKRGSDAPRPGLLRLEGARVAILNEADSRDWWDLGQTKKLTGGDTVSERNLNKAPYRSFKLEATFILHSNHMPKANGLDMGFQNRLVVIPFLSQFLPPDKLAEALANGETNVYPEINRTEMENRLNQEMSGILARLATAAMKLLSMGGQLPPPPPACRKKAEDYIYDQDLPGQFLKARCEIVPDLTKRIRANVLYRAFKSWCETEKDIDSRDVMKNQPFGRAIRTRLKNTKRDSSGWLYLGIRLLEDFEIKKKEREDDDK